MWKAIQSKLQKFGGAMYTPVLFTAFAGMMAGLSIVCKNPNIFGDLATESTIWYKIWHIIGEGAWTVFRQMPIIFAVGLPIGLAKKQAARASLVAILSYLTFNYYIQTILMFDGNDVVTMEVGGETGLIRIAGITTYDMSILGAIIVALLTVWVHDRYFDKKLPEYIGTFNGSVFIYVIMFFMLIPVAFLTHLVWPAIQSWISQGQNIIIETEAFGVGIYTFLERALIPTGLHHLVYQPFEYGPIVIEGGAKAAWIEAIPEISGQSGKLSELFPAGGYLMFGMSKIFGTIGMALAFYATAAPEKKKRTLGLLIPISLTAILVGVTEPFEFSFLFIAPILFFIHAFLAAAMTTVMFVLGLSGDFGSGIINWTTLNYLPMWDMHKMAYAMQWGVGLGFTAIYFFIFRALILKWDLKTPGRELAEEVKFYKKKDFIEKNKQNENTSVVKNNENSKVLGILESLGGVNNILDVSNCATRLRLKVKDETLVRDDGTFRSFGAQGLVKSGDSIQVIIGLSVPQFRDEFEEEMAAQLFDKEKE